VCLSPPPSCALLWCALRAALFLALSGFSPPQALRWRGGPPAQFISPNSLLPSARPSSLRSSGSRSLFGWLVARALCRLITPSLLAGVEKARPFLFSVSCKSSFLRAFSPFQQAVPIGGGGEANLPFFFCASCRSRHLSCYFPLYWSLSKNKKRGVKPLFNFPKKNHLRKEVKIFKIAVSINFNSPLLKPPPPLPPPTLDFYP
jgi:hypothetical protein